MTWDDPRNSVSWPGAPMTQSSGNTRSSLDRVDAEARPCRFPPPVRTVRTARRDHVPGSDPYRQVTIAFIAEQAGVSVPTVSKVINGRSGVGAQTRARVETLINEYGYRRPEPGQRARHHGTGHGRPGESVGRWRSSVASSGPPATPRRRRPVRLRPATDTRPAAGSRTRWPAGRTASSPSPSSPRRNATSSPPAASRSWSSTWPPSCPTTPRTSAPPTGSAAGPPTRHLLELGHRRIAMISGPDHLLCCRARLDGYRVRPGGRRHRRGPRPHHARQPLTTRPASAGGRRAARPAGPPDRHLHRQRRSGARRVPGRPRGGPAHPGGPERGRASTTFRSWRGSTRR